MAKTRHLKSGMVGVLGFFAYFSRAFDVSFREGIVVVEGGVPTRGWGFSLHVS